MQRGRSISHDVPLKKASEASAIWDGGDNGADSWGGFSGLVFGLVLLGWFYWVGFRVVFNGLIVGVVSGPAGIAPAINAKRAGRDGLREKGMSAVRHAAAQYATSGRQGPARHGMKIALIVGDDLASVGCRLCVGFVISTAVILNGGYIYKIGCTIS